MNDFIKSLRVEIGDKEEVIPVEPNTAEDVKKLYELHKQKRNGRVYKKFGKEYEPEHATIDREWQKEIMQDLEMEFNERNYGGYR